MVIFFYVAIENDYMHISSAFGRLQVFKLRKWTRSKAGGQHGGWGLDQTPWKPNHRETWKESQERLEGLFPELSQEKGYLSAAVSWLCVKPHAQDVTRLFLCA